jgi:hypothetical protein
MSTYRTHTVSVGIKVSPETVYDYAADPSHLPAWAPGFVHSIERTGDHWVGQTTLGEVRLRFAPVNSFGVLDHQVELPSGTVSNAMRVIPNGLGCEVLFTAIQLPAVSDEQFRIDLDTVRADLNKLRTLLEHRHPMENAQ